MEKKLLTVQMNAELYWEAKQKCKRMFGISLGPLIKVFLRAFTRQQGVGFFVGDVDLRSIFSRWLSKKFMEKGRGGCAPMPGPTLRELYGI